MNIEESIARFDRKVTAVAVNTEARKAAVLLGPHDIAIYTHDEAVWEHMTPSRLLSSGTAGVTGVGVFHSALAWLSSDVILVTGYVFVGAKVNHRAWVYSVAEDGSALCCRQVVEIEDAVDGLGLEKLVWSRSQAVGLAWTPRTNNKKVWVPGVSVLAEAADGSYKTCEIYRPSRSREGAIDVAVTTNGNVGILWQDGTVEFGVVGHEGFRSMWLLQGPHMCPRNCDAREVRATGPDGAIAFIGSSAAIVKYDGALYLVDTQGRRKAQRVRIPPLMDQCVAFSGPRVGPEGQSYVYATYQSREVRSDRDTIWPDYWYSVVQWKRWDNGEFKSTNRDGSVQ